MADGATNKKQQDDASRVIVLSGPSGSGKSTVVNGVIGACPYLLVKSISATTRPRRPKEVDGEDYHFLTNDDFEARRANGEFLECEEVHSSGFWYGTLRSEVDSAHDRGGWAFLEIDVQGALRVMQQYPEAITIFLKTSTEAVFEQRLRNRGTESEEVIQRRLQTARNELQLAHNYRHQVVNDDLNRVVEEIVGYIKSREAELNA